MNRSDDTRPDRAGPEAAPDRRVEPGLKDYREKLDRSLAELDAAMAAELPALRVDDASGVGAEGKTVRGSVSRRAREDEWDRPAVLPYLTATVLAVAAMALLVTATALPAPDVFQIGLTFLAVAMVVRRLEDLPQDSDNPVLAWLHDRAVALEGKFGVEFYGIAALTSFLRAEADLVTGLSLSDLVANPVSTAISWFVSALLESVVNAVWASLWWLQLMQEVDGLPLLAAIIGAGWVVWKILDITPDPGDG